MVDYNSKGKHVSATEINTDAVGNAEIADDAVDSGEIVAGAIDSAHIAAGAIVNEDVNAAAAIVESKLSLTYSTGHISSVATMASDIAQSDCTDGLMHFNTSDSNLSVYDATTSSWYHNAVDSTYTYT